MGSGYTEGDYIRTVDGLFFAVKGGRHSDELVIAILRYIPDEKGDRVKDDKRYHRVYDIASTTRYLEEYYPQYINYINWLELRLQSVPTSKIAKVFRAKERLKSILVNPVSELEKRVKDLVDVLSEASGVSSECFGVSGSLLIGLDTLDSDIDLNVYGETEGRLIYGELKSLREKVDWISPYDAESIEPVLRSRWINLGQEMNKLRAIECRKVLHGLFYGIDYFIRLLIDEEDSTSKPIKAVTISATIADSSHGIYTPCTYLVKDVNIQYESQQYDITELRSYRGKFTEQAKTGDRVLVRGRMEQVMKQGRTSYRLILGHKGDYLVPV
jgi:predicted nucleotidyltransferase